jgi:hypothetical protein
MALIIFDEITGCDPVRARSEESRFLLSKVLTGGYLTPSTLTIRSWVTKDRRHKWEVASGKPSGRNTGED